MAAVDYERLASWYDALVVESPDLHFFLEESRRAAGPVMELMAGTGRLAVPLAREGIDLTCLDSSPAMLERLRAKLETAGLQARLLHADACAFGVERPFRLLFIAFHSFEEIPDDAGRHGLLDRAFRALEPGGRLIVTLHDPRVRLRSVGPGREVLRDLADPATGDPVEFRLETRVLADGLTVEGREIFRRPGGGPLLLDLPLRFRLCPRSQFASLAASHGFATEALLGGYDRAPYTEGASSCMIWILSRPS